MGVAELVEGIDGELADLRQKVSALESARNALVGDNGNVAAASPPKPAARTTGNGRKRGRGRPRGGGTRSDEALKLVAGQPGISIPEMANAMGIEANYLYRVLPRLANEQKVKRDGQGWFPVT